jgi:NADH-quinone oxidoreductase subunit H
VAELLAEYAAEYLGPEWQWAAYTLFALVQVVIIIAIVVTLVAAFTWAERKVAGRLQDRLGPTRVGGRFGWLQVAADGIKLLCKEDLVPAEADAFLFRLAPYISFTAAFSVFMAIPLADGWVPVQLNVAVFFVLAVAGLEVFGVILAGYASGSKWSLFGAMREAAQVVSYEVPMAMCVVVPVMVAGTMDLVAIGHMQEGWCWNWLIFHDPFIFVVFWIYVVCAVASVNRAPFDLPEAESELVAGFMTEYSGFRWSVFFMGEYTSMLAVSMLAAILFFGGWNGPVPVASIVGLTHDNGPIAEYLGNLLGVGNMLFKGIFGVTVMIWVRWSLPRLRIDQVLTTCLKYCVPLAAMMFVGAMLWMYALPGGVLAQLRAGSPAAEKPTAAATVVEKGGV